MERITEKDLKGRIERLNKIAGPGYELDGAYGGYRLWKGGSVRLNCGYTTKRDLYNRIGAYIEGIELGLTIGKIAKNNL